VLGLSQEAAAHAPTRRRHQGINCLLAHTQIQPRRAGFREAFLMEMALLQCDGRFKRKAFAGQKRIPRFQSRRIDAALEIGGGLFAHPWKVDRPGHLV